MEPILEVKNLSVSFKTEIGYAKAVNQMSYQIYPGEIVGLVGESGSGKSVSSFAVIGLLPKHNSKVDSGEVIFEGKDLLKTRKKDLRAIRGKEISMIFQEPMTSLNPVFTIGSQLSEIFYNHTGLSKKEVYAKVLKLLERVGISRGNEIYKAYPHQLSGGMRQRVMIAMAIALKPKILIADEPTTALDVTIQAQILNLIKKLAREDSMAVVFISHNLGIISQLCQRVFVMYANQLVEQAEVMELYKTPLHPYTMGLLSCIPQIGNHDKKLNYIEGTVPHPGEIITGCRFASRCQERITECLETAPELIESKKNHYCRCLKRE